jgi:excisionase family DNA binding protein
MSHKSIPKRAYTVAEFCRAYGVSRSRAYELMAGNAIEYRQLGARRLILADSIDGWLASLPGNAPAVAV